MDAAGRRRLRKLVRERREATEHLGVERSYAELRRAAIAGELGPTPPGEGWLYEAFGLPDKDAVFAAARAGGRIGGPDLAAASRIYTPRPIVDLILQNTLGALWLQMHPTSPLAERWPLLVPEAVGPPVAARPLRDLRLLDPCCGAGAFLGAALEMIGLLAGDERRAAAAGAVPADWCLAAADVAPHAVGVMLHGADIDAQAVAIVRRELTAAAGGREAGGVSVVPAPLGSLDPDVWAPGGFDVVCTNPPWVGFRQLDAEVKRRVVDAVELAEQDLAVAVQARCQDLVAPGGRIGTVTPAAWLAGRPARALRERIVAEGGPVLVVRAGQGVFPAAPLVFVAITVVERGSRPDRVTVVEGRSGPEGRDLESVVATRRSVPLRVLESLPSLPFATAAPTPLLTTGARAARRIGDLVTMFDGVWTGDNRRDLRCWWEVGDDPQWVPISGGQGFQPWVASTHLRIRGAEVTAQPSRDGCLEYARVAGGRLGVRAAQPGTAALAGVVTVVVRDGDPAVAAEILAVCNSRVGAAWVGTLTAGLNFNPGAFAQIPLGAGPASGQLVRAVDHLLALRGEVARRDPSHDGFAGPAPWDDDLSARIAAAENELDALVVDHLGLGRSVLRDLPSRPAPVVPVPPVDDLLLVAALRAMGFGWPGSPGRPTPVSARDAVIRECRAALGASGAPEDVVDVGSWVDTRLAAVVRRRFRGRLAISAVGDRLEVRALAGGVRDPAR